MPEEFKPGCQRPSAKRAEGKPDATQITTVEDVKPSMIKVGRPAPDFTAPAYHQGKFVTTSLSEYKGKWVVLCFYPGDFTFV